MGSHQKEGFQLAQSGTLGAGGATCCSAPREGTGALMEQLGGLWMLVWEDKWHPGLLGTTAGQTCLEASCATCSA